ncbi:class F sortase [Micromonospora zhanjiangensis]|uniref:Class F sortase n=1 Tax=Micromonospora zhanjiangensis TaxID=1522057 RepID=A0ABV8KIP0_9ACTN
MTSAQTSSPAQAGRRPRTGATRAGDQPPTGPFRVGAVAPPVPGRGHRSAGLPTRPHRRAGLPGRWTDRRSDRRPRWIGPLAVVLLLFGIFATGAGLGQSAAPWTWLSGGDKEPPRSFPVLKPSIPIRLAVKSIGVQAPVMKVGLADDGSIAVPELAKHNQAGWYDRGPTPGQFGPAIIVGHADTKTGPSVFHDLVKLRPGARIEITREDRSTAIFEVNSVEQFDKGKLPIERVYGDYSRPVLRLITCGGQWRGGSIGYADNVIAFASLVSSRKP